MPFMPFQVLGIWLRGLLALAIIGAGIFLLRDWSLHRDRVELSVAPEENAGRDRDGRRAHRARVDRVVIPWHFGFNRPTAELLGGLALLSLSLGGGSLVVPLLRRRGVDDPEPTREGEVHRLTRPDGSVLHVECYGPADAQPIVLTHGWGADSTEWIYFRRELGDRYRLIVWDLPGLGRSKRPDNNDYRLENLADALKTVLTLAGDRPALLLGHSIGGMTILTFCRLVPEALGRRVAGLVLVHTSYTNPVRTTKMGALYSALQKPVLEPLCHLMIWLAPVVWVMNVLSYLNGSLHQQNDSQVFCGTETRWQLDFVSRYLPKAWPGVLARGMLGMFRYDATETLARIGVPTLVIAGDRDETTLPEASVTIAEAIPNAELVTLMEAKHMGLIEHHRRFAEVVDAFAQAVARREPVASPID